MSSKWKKPNWYPDKDVIATNSGWVYTKNHNEVLEAISHLKDKLSNSDNTLIDTGIMDLSDISFDSNLYVFQGNGSINKENIITNPTNASFKSYKATTTDLTIGQNKSIDMDNTGNYQLPPSTLGYLNLSKVDNDKVNKSVAYIICGGVSIGLMYNSHMNKNSSSYMIKAFYFDTPTSDEISNFKQLSSPTLEDMQVAFTPYTKSVMDKATSIVASSSDETIAKIAYVNLGSGQGVYQITTYNKSGDVTFTFKDSENHTWTHSATVVETPFIESIKIVGDGFDIGDDNSLEPSQTRKVKIETTPNNVPYDNLTWKSSNPEILQIDSSGNVTNLVKEDHTHTDVYVTITATINGSADINPIITDEVEFDILYAHPQA